MTPGDDLRGVGEIPSASLAGRLGVINGEGAIGDGLRAGVTRAGGHLTDAAGMGEAGIDPVPSFWIEVVRALPSLRSFVDLEELAFKDECEDVMWAGVRALQNGLAFLSGGPGTILIVLPTLSMGGAPGQVAYATALDGLRALVKSAARQWGNRGVRINCLALAPELFDGHRPDTGTFLARPALGGPGDVEHDIALTAVFLCGPSGRFVTGLTLCVDGGTWMAP